MRECHALVFSNRSAHPCCFALCHINAFLGHQAKAVVLNPGQAGVFLEDFVIDGLPDERAKSISA